MQCILHIGIEKTGTTTLQTWLYTNHDALRRQGIGLSRVLQHPNNRDMVAYFRTSLDDFAKMARIADATQKAAYFKDFEANLDAEIARLSAQGLTHMLFTSEHFHSRLLEPEDIASLHGYLVERFEAIQIVCYIREQSALRRSLYSTALKAEVTEGLEDFHTEIDEGHFYYDFNSVLSRWANVFGSDALRVRIFDRNVMHKGDIRHDFLNVALPFVAEQTLDFEIAYENKSLTHLESFVFRAINRWRPFFRTGGGIDPVNLSLKEAIRKVPQLRIGTLRSALNTVIRSRFEASNAIVSERYFDGKPLFRHTAQKEETNQQYSLEETGVLIEATVDAVLRQVGRYILTEPEIDLLRDVAFTIESDRDLSREQAIQLLQIAQRARPKGPLIAQKLKDLTSNSAAPATPGPER
ncbi:MAG: hypothetical protein AAGF36_08140 [Pseudomonadota bacterium]